MAKQTTRTLSILPSPTGGFLLKATVETNDGSRKQVLLCDNMQKVVADCTAEAFQRALFAFNGAWFDVREEETSQPSFVGRDRQDPVGARLREAAK